ncbi:replicative DNA helicase [Sphingomonas arantia]|uniref:DNA 5'-3' helicase n=1 Tax=Sphingomonas arantia TaxID=1460676 RepID=A0ABW4TX39_9SPHN
MSSRAQAWSAEPTPANDTRASAVINPEAEFALLGGLMIENRLVDAVADRLAPEDFSEPLAARIFSAILHLVAQGQAANPITLRPLLAGDPDMVEQPGFLAQLTGSSAALIGARDFADQIAELANRRRLMTGLEAAVALAGDLHSPVAQVVDAADAAIVDATIRRDPLHQPTGAECFDELLASYGDPVKGVTCGQIEALDRVLGAIRPKQLIVAAGRPGMGKTAVALSYSIGAARGGQGVLFVSLEMGSTELAGRMAADMCFDGRTGIPYQDIRDGSLSNDQLQRVCRARGEIADMPLYVVDAGSMTIGRLAMIVRRYKRRLAAKGQSLDLVVVDYLQLLSSDARGRSNYETVSEVSRGLKAIAKDQSIGILALAQLSRDVERRPDKRPIMPDLRDSGQIEQDADGILFLFRLEYYLRQAEPDADTTEWSEWDHNLRQATGRIEFIVAKRRGGRTGTAMGSFLGEYQAVRS